MKVETGSAGEHAAIFDAKRLSAPGSPRILTEPFCQLLIIIFAVFLAETAAALVLSSLKRPLSLYEDVLFGSFMVILIIVPVLYVVMLRPLRFHIVEFRRIEKALRESEERYVLAMQGAFMKHIAMLEKTGAHASEVRTAGDLDLIDGLIIPGG